MARGDSVTRGRARSLSKPSGRKRKRKEQTKERYQRAREDAQLEGVIPTSPEGASKPERIEPSSQSIQRFPELIGLAIRRGWAVPDEKKPGLVDEMVDVVHDMDAAAVAKVMAFKALAQGDQLQHERDQEYIKVERVVEMWRGVLLTIRNHVQDPELVKLIVGDVLKFLPVLKNGTVSGTLEIPGVIAGPNGGLTVEAGLTRD